MNALSFLSGIAFWRARDRGSDCGCPDRPGGDPGFSAALTALGAKLARADGRSDQVEFDTFLQAFPADPAAARDIARLYRLAGETTLGYEGYARRIGRRYRDCPDLLERVVQGLFAVAEADGVVTDDELAYLERASGLMGLSPLAFRRLRDEHLGAPADDPYRVLQVAPDAADETVRSAWKQALAIHHPDRAAGGSAAEIETATAFSAAINAAYEQVMRERRAFASAA